MRRRAQGESATHRHRRRTTQEKKLNLLHDLHQYPRPTVAQVTKYAPASARITVGTHRKENQKRMVIEQALTPPRQGVGAGSVEPSRRRRSCTSSRTTLIRSTTSRAECAVRNYA